MSNNNGGCMTIIMIALGIFLGLCMFAYCG